MDKKAEIRKDYKNFLLDNNRPPLNAHVFAESMKMDEKELYDHYSGMDAVKQDVWVDYLRKTIEQVEAEEVYEGYSTREKLLSFYYTLLEVLKQERTFTIYFLARLSIFNLKPAYLESFRKEFIIWLSALFEEGQGSHEIEQRPILTDQYVDWHWPQMIYILHYWAKDKSEDFQLTDEAIEKVVNLGFDFMSHNVADSAVGFARFLIKGII